MLCVQASGCRWTGLTLSKEQLEEASKRVKAAGLSDRVTLLFCDYRDCPGAGSYSKVLSCEMIEAVGQEHLVSYFRTIGAMLRPGGTAVIQVRLSALKQSTSLQKPSNITVLHPQSNGSEHFEAHSLLGVLLHSC